MTSRAPTDSESIPSLPGDASGRTPSRASHWRRALLIWIILLLLVAAAALICPFLGATDIDPLLALGFREPVDGVNTDAQIFRAFRLPRTLFGLLAGAALALAGTVFQALLRNDLATPYTLGVSGGAAVGALLVLWLAPVTAAAFLVPASAFFFAMITVAIIYALARFRGAVTPPETILLAGVTLNLLYGAVILLIQFRSTPYQTVSMVRWLMGGLDVSGKLPILFASGVVFLGSIVLMAHARSLNLLSRGEMTAAHLGVAVERTRGVSLIAASLITAAVVSLAGPIGFVGLIVPHALRLIIGPDHRVLMPAAVLAGAAFLVICDAVARILFAPTELPVGVITSFLGAPFFLWLLFRKRR